MGFATKEIFCPTYMNHAFRLCFDMKYFILLIILHSLKPLGWLVISCFLGTFGEFFVWCIFSDAFTIGEKVGGQRWGAFASIIKLWRGVSARYARCLQMSYAWVPCSRVHSWWPFEKVETSGAPFSTSISRIQRWALDFSSGQGQTGGSEVVCWLAGCAVTDPCGGDLQDGVLAAVSMETDAPKSPWQSGGGCGSKSMPWTLEASGRWMQAPSELPISGPSIWTRQPGWSPIAGHCRAHGKRWGYFTPRLQSLGTWGSPVLRNTRIFVTSKTLVFF